MVLHVSSDVSLSTPSHRRTILPWIQRRMPATDQWSRLVSLQHHKVCDVLGSGSRSWINLQQCQGSSTTVSYVRGNGTPTAPHPHTNRQFNSIWDIKQQSQPKKIKSHERKVLLGQGQNCASTIQSILGARW
jgi:hypothetical protein